MATIKFETNSVGVILVVFGIAFMLLSWATHYLNVWFGVLGIFMLLGGIYVAKN